MGLIRGAAAGLRDWWKTNGGLELPFVFSVMVCP